MLKKAITILLILLFCHPVFAERYEATVKGLRYNLKQSKYDKNSGFATVTYKSTSEEENKNYVKGDLVIPDKIKVGGKEYYVTGIEYWAFKYCEGLTSVTIPDSVHEIGDLAFSECTNLTTLYIPKNVTIIGKWSFRGCKSLESIVVDKDNKKYDSRDNCNAIIETSSGKLLAGCKNSKVPNGITSIEKVAFWGCDGLKAITLPESVNSIGESAFFSCDSLRTITMPTTLTGGIGNSAFWGCEFLKSIIIPYGVGAIQEETFKYCKSLSSVTLPPTLKVIEKEAFYSCDNLSSISIPDGVTDIGEKAFEFSGVKDVSLPKSVQNIGKDAFWFTKLYVATAPLAEKFRKNTTGCQYEIDPNLNGSSALASSTIAANAPKPLLTLVDGSLELLETNDNQTIEANEQCKIRFRISNKGKGAAVGCLAKVKGTGNTAGLTFGNVSLPTIGVGATYTVDIPVSANLNTQDGTATFAIEVTEPNGLGVDPMTLTVNTHAFDAPMLKIVDYAVSGNGTIQKKQPFDLKLLLQNTQYGKAENVDVKIVLPANVLLMDGEEETKFASLDGGMTQHLNYQVIVTGNYSQSSIPIQILLKEKFERFAENRTITLDLNQQLSSTTSVTLQGQLPQKAHEAIAIGAIGSAVDRNIPQTNDVNGNTFVVIIANENYMSVASVPFALNDGMKFHEYCHKTLGVPEKNIKYVANATGNQIKAQVQWLDNVTNVFESPNVIFYYAGHGIPDESSKTAYLLPVDGIGTDISTGYKLDNLYAALGNMPTRHTTIFLDACFSGSKREDGMLSSARGVAIKARSGVPQGNMVVFSAAQGDETAYPNNEEGHGMFTYFLLKKLQETGGDVTLSELASYITKNVSQQSILLNGKSQTPNVSASSALGADWQGWKLK